MIKSSWAIVRCKYADDHASTLPDSHYQRLFTPAGAGSFNVVDYFRDMSHGQLDLSGSKIFGWYNLPINHADFTNSPDPAPAGRYNRRDLFNLCRQAAVDNSVPLADFQGILAIVNGGTGVAYGFMGEMTALCESTMLAPSAVCHEMGHGYGLDHSRSSAQPSVDYMDAWDTMSTLDLCYMHNTKEWGSIGPGLNSWNMRGRGWLDEGRVWKLDDSDFEATVVLRPLHRPDLYGSLALELGEFLFAYRPRQGWDAAFPESGVFIHTFEDNHSYIRGNNRFYMVAGGSYTGGSPDLVIGTYVHVEVISIDDAAQAATLKVRYQHKALHLPRTPVLVGTLLGGVAVDAGGGIIINGHYRPIPPRDGLFELIKQIENYAALKNVQDVRLRMEARRSVLDVMDKAIALKRTELEPTRVPAPRGDPKTRVPDKPAGRGKSKR